MGPQKGWLKCRVSEGMFPEERAVVCTNLAGISFSFFAPETRVKQKEGLVEVNIMDCQNDKCLVFIPFEPLGGMSRTQAVYRKDITEIQ